MQSISILGAGSWGTALAAHLARTGHDVRLWGRDAALVDQLTRTRENTVYLPGIALPDAVRPCESLADALGDASMVIFAVPSHGLRAMLSAARPHMPRGVPIVSTVKGIERETLLRMSEVMAQEIDAAHPIVVLSGPSFAV